MPPSRYRKWSDSLAFAVCSERSERGSISEKLTDRLMLLFVRFLGEQFVLDA